MIDITLDEKLYKDMEEIFVNTPEMIEKSLKIATKKTILSIKKLSIKTAKNEYINAEDTLNSSSIRVSNKNGEAILFASTKRGRLEDFYVSLTTPGHSKERLKAQVLKKSGTKTTKTMFWGNFKKNPTKVGLFIRLGTRKEIAPVRTVSPFTMLSKVEESLVLEEVQDIFNNALEKVIYKGKVE